MDEPPVTENDASESLLGRYLVIGAVSLVIVGLILLWPI